MPNSNVLVFHAVLYGNTSRTIREAEKKNWPFLVILLGEISTSTMD